LIFVDQSSEDGSTADPLLVEVGNGRLGSGRAKLQRPVEPVAVVATRKSHVVSELVKEARRMSKT
jgi:hypothetical protein